MLKFKFVIFLVAIQAVWQAKADMQDYIHSQSKSREHMLKDGIDWERLDENENRYEKDYKFPMKDGTAAPMNSKKDHLTGLTGEAIRDSGIGYVSSKHVYLFNPISLASFWLKSGRWQCMFKIAFLNGPFSSL